MRQPEDFPIFPIFGIPPLKTQCEELETPKILPNHPAKD
jgi:hypothetical protein